MCNYTRKILLIVLWWLMASNFFFFLFCICLPHNLHLLLGVGSILLLNSGELFVYSGYKALSWNIWNLKLFSYSLGLYFHSLNRVLCRAIVLKVDDVQSGLPQWLSSKESTCNSGAAGDLGLIPRSGRSPGGGHGNLLQYSCLENPIDTGASRAIVNGIAKRQTWLKWLNTHTYVMYKLLLPFC